MITKKYYKVIRVSYEDQQYLTLTNTSETIGGFKVQKIGNPNPNLEYSLNGTDWTTYDLTNLPTIEIPVGGHIYLRGNNSNGFCSYVSNWCYFNMDVSHTASGNMFSLINKDPETFSTYTTTKANGFKYLFWNDNYLTNVSGMIINMTSLNDSTFDSMFYNCRNLVDCLDLKNIVSVGTNSLSSLYKDCKKINTAIAPNISTWGSTTGWLEGAGSEATGTKTVYAPTGLEIPTNNSGIPNGWTRVDY